MDQKISWSKSKKKSFGAKVIVTLANGKQFIEILNRADAHPYGQRPFKRQDYINKFTILTKKIITKKESKRFLNTVQKLRQLKKGQLYKLNVEISNKKIKRNKRNSIF